MRTVVRLLALLAKGAWVTATGFVVVLMLCGLVVFAVSGGLIVPAAIGEFTDWSPWWGAIGPVAWLLLAGWMWDTS